MTQWFLAIICVSTCFGTTPAHSSKPIAIVICSYNNRKYCQKNLESALNQDYSNYRIIYVDDCSPDGTADAVEELANNHPNKHRFQLVRNKSRRKAMENLWRAIHMCNDDEIVITLDGDDWFPHNKVLTTVASYYADPTVWIAYSNYITHPYRKPGISRPWNQNKIDSVGVRRHRYVVSHLRSFYAGLFKQVKLQDLTYKGGFVPTTYDLAMFFPMLEMAAGHIRFMKEKLYVYNVINPISDCKVRKRLQAKIDKHTRYLTPYQPINFHPAQKNASSKEEKIDLVVFSYNRPTQLHAFLESLYKLTKNFNDVHVVYRSDNSEYERGYEIVKNTFPEVTWKRQKRAPHDFKSLTIQSAFEETSHANYIAFASDAITIKDELDFQDAARLLNKTKGYAFLLRLGKEAAANSKTKKHNALPRYMQIEPGAMAWQISQVDRRSCWGYVNNLDMTIYRKEEIKPYFMGQSNFTNPDELKVHWQQHCNRKNIVLCYDTSKIAKSHRDTDPVKH
ncbi:MAG: glycosyltransferase [Chlamydiia bacterium]|nr:glycosyltransferase [Chlamydiia bacterium]